MLFLPISFSPSSVFTSLIPTNIFTDRSLYIYLFNKLYRSNTITNVPKGLWLESKAGKQQVVGSSARAPSPVHKLDVSARIEIRWRDYSAETAKSYLE